MITQFWILILVFFQTQNYSGQYKVVKIDAGAIFIEHNNYKAIIVYGNDSLVINKSYRKIKVGKKYYFNLPQKMEDKTRLNSGFIMLDSINGNKKIWDVKKDGPLPDIFFARNVKGLYVKEDLK
ncbi:hypothetical protein [Flavobacterium chilense]|uniref:Uncharacterized protein n=1 Tax=Flavobacterium chilense TaxID=946677 RepID=A0A1M7IQ07_9FLAO|nr:hypothetical protein [Flavobacterium chilense]SHM42759.1 hypothetical protein SAMN05444484_1062 [Flavobacterium chilense]